MRFPFALFLSLLGSRSTSKNLVVYQLARVLMSFEALRSAGASPARTATHAVLPSVIPQFTSLFLYRVDVNLRDSLTLGVVGAGGIGFASPRPSRSSSSPSR